MEGEFEAWFEKEWDAMQPMVLPKKDTRKVRCNGVRETGERQNVVQQITEKRFQNVKRYPIMVLVTRGMPKISTPESRPATAHETPEAKRLNQIDPPKLPAKQQAWNTLQRLVDIALRVT